MAQRGGAPGSGPPAPRPAAGSDAKGDGPAPDVRRIEVRPDQVLQPDRRPWARLSLDQVVVRAMAVSGAVIALFLALAAGAAKLIGLW